MQRHRSVMYLYVMDHFYLQCSSMFSLVRYGFYLFTCLLSFLKKTLTYSCFRLGGLEGIDGLWSVAYTANSFI